MGRNCGRPGLGADRQFGKGAHDSLVGDIGRGRFHGRGGDDRLEGGAGRDWLHGGRGNDQLSGADGNDWLFGGHGDDHLFGGAGRDRLFGHFGDDRLEGGAERDYLHGGRGDDLLSGGDDDDHLRGGPGNDQLAGRAGNDHAYGGWGDDVFVYHDGDGNDFFHGEHGTADTIRLDSVADGWTLHLRRGEVMAHEGEQLHLSRGAAGFILFADGSKLRFQDVERIETVQSEPAPSVPVPTNHAPGVVELSTNVVLENAADGTVVGVVSATDPDAGDALTYALLDNAGGRFTIDPTSGAIMVADGSLLDYEVADQHSVVVQATDAGGLSDSETFSIAVQFDNSGDDPMIGSAGDDVIEGGAGDDSLYGETGDDHLIGGDGNDAFDGGPGDDVIEGGDGDDVMDGGNWVDAPSGNDRIEGGAGADTLDGGDGDDVLDGGDGDDQLLGGHGHDRLDGGAGDDSLFGNSGDDVLDGGGGTDTLSGGMGADRFVFDGVDEGVDVITDFEDGDVLAIGNALTGFSAGQQADFVRLLDDGFNTTVQVDADGAANGSEYTSVAVLEEVTGTTLSVLVNAGQIDFLIA
jgi:Ca2+-binding RTX toxin-like protein